MIKKFILDTNVLLHDSQAMYKFDDNEVVIPITVIEEIDTFKKDLNEVGRNARQVSRQLDELRQAGGLTQGVPLDNGGSLRVVLFAKNYAENLPPGLKVEREDNRILSIAVAEMENCDCPVIFVTKDTNLRIKADVMGLKSQDYESDKVSISELYSGTSELEVPAAEIDRFYGQGYLEFENKEDENGAKLYSNQCLTLIDAGNPSHTALCRYHKREGRLLPLYKAHKEGIWGIQARNREQHFVLDILLDNAVQLVTLVGKAGTGKTLLAIAAGLQRVADDNQYTRLLISRPVFPMGRDLGFLPGDVEEKLAPWMQPIFDNVDLLLNNVEDRGKRKRGYRELVDMGIMEIEPLTYIRGRSIPNQYMIVDEAQNLTPHEIKTIITRAGEGTKIVLTGDPYQIDNPYVDSSSNGLAYVVEKFKGQDVAGHVTLTHGERSGLAELAANLL
ncbi:MAG: PhoH family protein [Desulfuromonadaceae bacterium]|nr:PhoH family protein [Geobacteraceae bacterium]